MRSSKLSKEAALSFILTHIVIEKNQSFEMNASSLFTLMNLAAEAEARLNNIEAELVPHEVVEEIASSFLLATSVQDNNE